MTHSALVQAWKDAGTYRTLCGHSIFTLNFAATEGETAAPLLVLHGFPTSSLDFHAVLEPLRRHRRVVLFDFLGYGLSDKPDQAYTMAGQADIAMAYVAELGIDRLALLTHDMGDTVGGELLARQAEGTWSVQITRRLLTNGSIYIEMAHLSDGQQFLLALPDQKLDAPPGDGAGIQASLRATFSDKSVVDDAELVGMWEGIAVHDGYTMLPRLIRYIEERRTNQARFTGAIETHPSPLDVVWGQDDPIAVAEMADRLVGARPDARLEVLHDVGHYAMVEDPARFAAAAGRFLESDPA